MTKKTKPAKEESVTKPLEPCGEGGSNPTTQDPGTTVKPPCTYEDAAPGLSDRRGK